MTRDLGHSPYDLRLGPPAPDGFLRVRWREGYARRQVDAFVDEAVQAVTSGDPTMRPEDVRAVRFTPVRLRSGYDMRAVDEFLDAVEQRLVAQQPAATQAPEPPPAVTGARSPLRVWADRVRWAVPVLVVVIGVCANVFAH